DGVLGLGDEAAQRPGGGGGLRLRDEGVDAGGGLDDLEVDVDHRGDPVPWPGHALAHLAERGAQLVQDGGAHRALQTGLVGEVAVEDRLRGADLGGEVVHRQVGPAVVHRPAGGPDQLGAPRAAVGGPARVAAVDAGRVVGGGCGRHHATESIRYSESHVARDL